MMSANYETELDSAVDTGIQEAQNDQGRLKSYPLKDLIAADEYKRRRCGNSGKTPLQLMSAGTGAFRPLNPFHCSSRDRTSGCC